MARRNQDVNVKQMFDRFGEVVAAVLNAVIAMGGGYPELDEFRVRLIKDEDLRRQIAGLILQKAVSPIVSIAWSLILPWIIAACRFTSYVNLDITAENFPQQPDDFRIKDVITVAIDRAMSTLDVLAFLDSKGLRPATLVELLWWWLTHPMEQANCLVVALGSVWHGGSPFVNGDGDHRRLSLRTRENGWGEYYTFAAVSK